MPDANGAQFVKSDAEDDMPKELDISTESDIDNHILVGRKQVVSSGLPNSR